MIGTLPFTSLAPDIVILAVMMERGVLILWRGNIDRLDVRSGRGCPWLRAHGGGVDRRLLMLKTGRAAGQVLSNKVSCHHHVNMPADIHGIPRRGKPMFNLGRRGLLVATYGDEM
jgi:hypothetical protein